MKAVLNRLFWGPDASVTPEIKEKINPKTDHFAPILAEVEALGTDFDDLLRPAFRAYEDEVYAPLIESERRLMDIAMQMEAAINDLVTVAPNLIRAARGDHPLNVTDTTFIDDQSEGDR